MTLLFFVAAIYGEVPDCTGIGVIKYKSNAEIHAYLYKAVVQLPKKYSEYEPFNKMLHNIFFEKRFAFMHKNSLGF